MENWSGDSGKSPGRPLWLRIVLTALVVAAAAAAFYVQFLRIVENMQR